MLAISHYFIGKRSKNSLLAEMSTQLLQHIAGSRKFPPKDHRWLVRINHVSTIKLGGGKSERQFLAFWKATDKFLVFNDQRERKMRLNCEVSIVNRLGPSFSMRNSSKPARASLAIGRKESSKIAGGTAEKTVFLLVCTAKEKNGARYKVCTTLI